MNRYIEDGTYNDPNLVSSKISIQALSFLMAAGAGVVLRSSYWLYFTNDQTCAYQIPLIALVIGGLSIFISIVSLTSQCLMHDAWVDKRLTKQEHSMLWLFILQNRILVSVQVLMFFGFFVYLMTLFPEVVYDRGNAADPMPPTYCARNVYLFCTVLSGVMVLSAVIAAIFYAIFILVARR